MSTMTAKQIEEKFAAMERNMERMMAMVGRLVEGSTEESAVVVVEPQGTVTMTDSPDLASLKAWHKARGGEIRGAWSQERIDSVTAEYEAAHKIASGRVDRRNGSRTVKDDSDLADLIGTSKQSADKQWGRPKESDAVLMVRNHPMADMFDKLTGPKGIEFWTLTTHLTGRNGSKMVGNGNDRKMAYWHVERLDGRGRPLTASTTLVLCDFLTKMSEAGVLPRLLKAAGYR